MHSAFLRSERNRIQFLRRWHEQLERAINVLAILDCSRYRSWSLKRDSLIESAHHMQTRLRDKVDALENNDAEIQYRILLHKHIYNATDQRKEYERVMQSIQPAGATGTAAAEARTCSSCGSVEFDYDSARTLAICTTCGLAEQIQSNNNYSGAVPYGENQEIIIKRTGSTYKRINHFSEILALRQNKELGTVAPEVYEALEQYAYMLGIARNDYLQLPEEIIAFLLRGCGFSKFRDQTAQIFTHNSGRLVEQASTAQERAMRMRFIAVSDLWESVPEELGRGKSFISYKYVGRQIALLEGMYSFAQRFPILKGAPTLERHNRIWKWMCKQLQWPFTPVCPLQSCTVEQQFSFK